MSTHVRAVHGRASTCFATITADVKNDGNAVARTVVVRFEADGKMIGEKTLSTISAGVTTPVSIEWDGKEGTHEIEVIVDPANDISEKDEVFEDKGLKILIDKKSLLYLLGTTLDYTDGLNGKGFQFINPNASRTCGCGESFSD